MNVSTRTGRTCDLAVAGGGPAGLATALLAARAGLTVTIAAPEPGADHRTFALMAGAVRMLRRLGAWEALLPHAAPLRRLRLIDDTGRLMRAPSVEFDAGEIGWMPSPGIFPAAALSAVLGEMVRAQAGLTWLSGKVAACEPGESGCTLELEDGSRVHAGAVAAADGAAIPGAGRLRELRSKAGNTRKPRS